MIGVYGVISSTVIMRRRELGIRLAIGARPRELLAMILRQGLTLAFIGTSLGLLTALGVTRFAASLLYDVNPTDPVTFATVGSFSVVGCARGLRAACARRVPRESCRGASRRVASLAGGDSRCMPARGGAHGAQRGWTHFFESTRPRTTSSFTSPVASSTRSVTCSSWNATRIVK